MTDIPNGHGVLPPNRAATPVAGGLPGRGLRRFAVTRSPHAVPFPTPSSSSPDAAVPGERCELCREPLGGQHRHLVDPRERSIACACTACALLFTRPGGRYRTVPDRVCHDPARPLTAAEWAELSIPVSIAFFFVNSAIGHIVASYPSPAGVTECELDLAAWDRHAAAHPLLAALEPDVEAILVVDTEAFLIPIDLCYSLAGALRLNWHGFDGGAEVKEILSDLLADLRQRARPLAEA